MANVGLQSQWFQKIQFYGLMGIMTTFDDFQQYTVVG